MKSLKSFFLDDPAYVNLMDPFFHQFHQNQDQSGSYLHNPALAIMIFPLFKASSTSPEGLPSA